MKNIKYRLVALLLILVTIFANVQPALALEDYEVNLGVDILSAWNNWTPISKYSNGTMQYPGKWSYNSSGYIVNAENTDNMTGFYNPTTNYSDMDISISMGSWHADDDYMGCLVRFSEDKDHNCTGYVFMMPNTINAYPDTSTYGAGLYKITGKQLSFNNLTKCVGVSDLYWTRSAYRTVRIVTSGNNIKVYVDGTLYANYTDTNAIEAGSYGFFSISQPDARFKEITGKATLAHFTAFFNANDGTLSGDKSKIVTSTKTYGTLPTATRKGYIFDGWYDAKTGGNKITSTDAVGISSDTTFYAHWTPVESTINFDANSGTISTASKKVYYEQKIGEMPTPTKTGYTFAGWCTDKDGKGGYITSDYEIAWDTSRTATLYAQWTINKYKNKYKHWAWGFKNEGNNSNKTAFLLQTTYGEETYNEEFTPDATYGLTVPNGFYLAGRFKNNQITGSWQTFNFGTKLTQPAYVMNFEYDYYPTDYTITYNLNGGTNNSNNPSKYNVLYGVTFSNPTKAGYDFAGWYDANENKITGINEGCNATFSDTADLYSKLKTRTTGNISVTAKWTPHNYTISYNLNGGTANNKTSYTIETEKFTLNVPTKKGYTFVGWTGSNGTTAQKTVSIAKGSTGNKSYTANWTPINYTIKYDANGGSGTMADSTIAFMSGGTVRKNTFTKTGYTFDVWYMSRVNNGKTEWFYGKTNNSWASATSWYEKGKNPTGTSLYRLTDQHTFDQSNYINNCVITAHAQWKKVTYTISYTLNGGSISGQKTTYDVETTTFTLPQPTKKGYTFVGWTGSNGTTPQKTVSIAKGSTGNKSYTAVFEKTIYTITTSKVGSGALSDNSKVEYDDSTSVFIIPAEGYITSSLKIDGVSVNPTSKYNFLNVNKDHKVEATFTISQNRKMELMQKGYKWIDLKL